MPAETTEFATGAVRSAGCAGEEGYQFPLRFDLLFSNGEALRRLAATFGEGFAKYGADNWKKGIPESNLLNHAIAHLALYCERDTTEDHLAHATWNLLTLMWQQRNKPELLDRTGSNS